MFNAWPERTPLEAAEDGRARERQIAQRVEDLVAYEFVWKTHQLGIDDAIAFDRQRVLQAGATAESGFEQRVELMHKAEGARGCDLAAETLG